MIGDRWGGVGGLLGADMPRRAALQRLGGVAGVMAGGRAAPAAAQGTPTPTSETAARLLVDTLNRVLAGEDPGLLDPLFAPGYVNRTPGRSLVTGQAYPPDLAGLTASLSELRSLVPDAALAVDEVVSSGDRAAIRFTLRGTVATGTASVLGNAGEVSAAGVIVLHLAGGLIAESWLYAGIEPVAAANAGQAGATPSATAAAQTSKRGVVREARPVSGVVEVALEGIGTLSITQGETESLTIEAEARILSRIGTEVQNGRLTIRPARAFRTRRPVTYALSVIQLAAIEVAGAGRIEAARLAGDGLRLVGSGSGAIAIGELSAATLDVSASGNAAFDLAGEVDRQEVAVDGAAQYRAADLASRAATITVKGAGQAVVRVSETLDVVIDGAGRVDYIGDPSVSQTISGAGRLTKAG